MRQSYTLLMPPVKKFRERAGAVMVILVGRAARPGQPHLKPGRCYWRRERHCLAPSQQRHIQIRDPVGDSAECGAEHIGKAQQSYRAMVGEAAVNPLARGRWSRFGRRRGEARQRYRRFVAEGARQESIWTGLRQQIYLGDEEFIRMMQQKVTAADEMAIPRVQIRPPAPSLALIAEFHTDRDEAIVAVYATDAFSYRQNAEHFGLHLATVGRIVRASLNT